MSPEGQYTAEKGSGRPNNHICNSVLSPILLPVGVGISEVSILIDRSQRTLTVMLVNMAASWSNSSG
jgi:hypothetical protein